VASRHSTRVSLPAKIADELRSQITQGTLQPGDQLPGHRDLAAGYGVSLGAAREAISLLIGDGHIETRAGRGTYVAERTPSLQQGGTPVSRKEIEELIEARELLGLSLAGMAAERASTEDVDRLRRAVARMQESAADAATFPEADLEFHVSLARAAGNRYLLYVVRDWRALIRADIELAAAAAIQRFGSLQFSVDAHRDLVDAIDAGEPDVARRILFDLMSRHHEFVLGLYALAPDGIEGT
jgi:GntR family transcriptional regulator, transcriptional repressor for pyruvate dehydrogenase complex